MLRRLLPLVCLAASLTLVAPTVDLTPGSTDAITFRAPVTDAHAGGKSAKAKTKKGGGLFGLRNRGAKKSSSKAGDGRKKVPLKKRLGNIFKPITSRVTLKGRTKRAEKANKTAKKTATKASSKLTKAQKKLAEARTALSTAVDKKAKKSAKAKVARWEKNVEAAQAEFDVAQQASDKAEAKFATLDQKLVNKNNRLSNSQVTDVGKNVNDYLEAGMIEEAADEIARAPKARTLVGKVRMAALRFKTGNAAIRATNQRSKVGDTSVRGALNGLKTLRQAGKLGVIARVRAWGAKVRTFNRTRGHIKDSAEAAAWTDRADVELEDGTVVNEFDEAMSEFKEHLAIADEIAADSAGVLSDIRTARVNGALRGALGRITDASSAMAKDGQVDLVAETMDFAEEFGVDYLGRSKGHLDKRRGKIIAQAKKARPAAAKWRIEAAVDYLNAKPANGREATEFLSKARTLVREAEHLESGMKGDGQKPKRGYAKIRKSARTKLYSRLLTGAHNLSSSVTRVSGDIDPGAADQPIAAALAAIGEAESLMTDVKLTGKQSKALEGAKRGVALAKLKSARGLLAAASADDVPADIREKAFDVAADLYLEAGDLGAEVGALAHARESGTKLNQLLRKKVRSGKDQTVADAMSRMRSEHSAWNRSGSIGQAKKRRSAAPADGADDDASAEVAVAD